MPLLLGIAVYASFWLWNPPEAATNLGYTLAWLAVLSCWPTVLTVIVHNRFVRPKSYAEIMAIRIREMNAEHVRQQAYQDQPNCGDG